MRILIFFMLIFPVIDLNIALANDFEFRNMSSNLKFYPKLFISVEILEPSINTLSRTSEEISSNKLKATFLLGVRWDFDFLVPDASYNTFMYEYRSKSEQEYVMLEKKLRKLLENKTTNLSQHDLVNYLSKQAEIKAQLVYFAHAF